jgi:hypothetical protein
MAKHITAEKGNHSAGQKPAVALKKTPPSPAEQLPTSATVTPLFSDSTFVAAEEVFPETKAELLALSRRIHDELKIRGASERLKKADLDKLFKLVGSAMHIRPAFLEYMAGTESSLQQTADNGAAHGIMQIERSAHPAAYRGTLNVGNDTITNVVYGAMLRAQTDRAMAATFRRHGLTPPTKVPVVEFLGDLAYNRGLGLLEAIARNAAEQKIDVDKFADYVAGRGGDYSLTPKNRIEVIPGPGTGVTKTGAGSVLAKALASVDAQQRVRLSRDHRDLNGDGKISHLDIWVKRGVRYMQFLETSGENA